MQGRSLLTVPTSRSVAQLSYKTVPFHRVIKGFVAQSGDITMHNGTGGEACIGNGKPFKDDREGLKKKLDKRGDFFSHHLHINAVRKLLSPCRTLCSIGLVAMGNKGKNSNTSRMFLHVPFEKDFILRSHPQNSSSF